MEERATRREAGSEAGSYLGHRALLPAAIVSGQEKRCPDSGPDGYDFEVVAGHGHRPVARPVELREDGAARPIMLPTVLTVLVPDIAKTAITLGSAHCHGSGLVPSRVTFRETLPDDPLAQYVTHPGKWVGKIGPFQVVMTPSP